jgi:hypothetical protein
MANPRCEHWVTVKRVFNYFQGTYEYSIFYYSDVLGDPDLVDIHSYVDSDWVGDVDRRISMRKYVFRLFGGAMSWMRKQQYMLSLSIVEANNMEATHACKESIWIMKLVHK